VRAPALTVAVAALALVASSPAAAMTGGFGISDALAGGPQLRIAQGKQQVRILPEKQRERTRTCDAEGPRAQAPGAFRELTKRFVPVACEQPPRSQFLLPHTLTQATAAALAVLG
jgi:hypothetical protein